MNMWSYIYIYLFSLLYIVVVVVYVVLYIVVVVVYVVYPGGTFLQYNCRNLYLVWINHLIGQVNIGQFTIWKGQVLLET